jgi:Methylamine utilisation protein MauE
MGPISATLDPVFARALAAAVSLVLLVGAVQKARDWDGFRAALANYRLLPGALVTPAALALPALEMFAGIALLAGPFRAAGSMLALAVLLTVTGAVAINLLRGRVDIDCGCGGVEGRQRLSWGLVARNAVVMLAAVCGTLEGAARELTWFDYGTVALASLALYGLYACTSQLLSNHPRLADLRNRS